MRIMRVQFYMLYGNHTTHTVHINTGKRERERGGGREEGRKGGGKRNSLFLSVYMATDTDTDTPFYSLLNTNTPQQKHCYARVHIL